MAARIMWASSLFYRLLLRAYPVGFRQNYGEEMLWFFECCCTDALRKGGAWALLGLWLRVLPDWGMTVIKERLQQAGYEGAKQMDTTQFDRQITSSMALFSRALRSGYSVGQCIDILIEHAPEPTRSVFVKIREKASSSGSLLEALHSIPDEVPSDYLRQWIAEMDAQRERGSNLADDLDALNRSIFPTLGDEGWAKSVDLDDGYDPETHYPLN